MATILESGVKKQGDGKFSVRVGNQKFNGLSRSDANSRSKSGFQVAPDSLTDSPNQKTRNLSLGIKAGDSNARRDSALRGTITSASLNPVGNIQLPTQNFGDNQMSTITGNNQGLTNTSMGITTTESGGLAYTPPTDGTTATATDPATNNFQAYLNTIQGLNDKKESASDTFKRIEKQSGLRQAQQDVQNYTSQINTITSNAQAQSLSLEGQGRGQTSSFVGGEQARISREAAIQALPIQALLANAQGNKELAQTHLDTRFKLEMQDAQSQYDYKLKVVGAVYEFASTQEKRRLDEIAQDKANEFTLKRDEAQFTRDKFMKQMGINADMAMFNAKLSAESKASVGQYSGNVASNVSLQGLSSDQKNNAVITSLLQGKSIGQGTKTQMANVLGVINAAQDIAGQRVAGKFKGISPFNAALDVKIPFTNIGIPFRQALTSKEGTENRQYLEAINLRTQIWASGASLTKTQIEQVDRFTPRPTDTDTKVKEKLNGLTNFMLSQTKTYLQSEGIDFVPEKVNLFETAELLEKASPAQRAELKAQGLI